MKRVKVVLVALNDPDNFTYSLPLGNIKAYCLKQEVISSDSEIIIKNYDLNNDDFEGILYGILHEAPDIVGFSCHVWNIKKIILLSEAIKKVSENILNVLGGSEVSDLAESYLKKSIYIDIIIRGEGEETFYSILINYIMGNKELDTILGITFQRNGKILKNADRPRIESLDEIPSPYINGMIRPSEITPAAYIEFCRGCNFRCTYCYDAKKGSTNRYFSLNRVKQDLEFMKKNNIRSVAILDPTINSDEKKFKDICKVISEVNSDNQLDISVEMKTELITDKLFSTLNSSKITMAGIGLQSSDQVTNKNIERYFDGSKFKEGVSILTQAGIKPYLDIINGLPGDNFFKYLTTIKYAISLKPYMVFFFHLNVLPGTKLRKLAKKFKIVFHKFPPYEVLSNYSFNFHEIYLSRIYSNSLSREFTTSIMHVE